MHTEHAKHTETDDLKARLIAALVAELRKRLHEVDEEVHLVRTYHLQYDDYEKKALTQERNDLRGMLERYSQLRTTENY